jgi:hypothetical protein
MMGNLLLVLLMVPYQTTEKFGLAAFNEASGLQVMFIEPVGSQYNRVIGNALDSVTRVQQHGIRLSGYDKDGNPAESTHAPNGTMLAQSMLLRTSGMAFRFRTQINIQT